MEKSAYIQVRTIWNNNGLGALFHIVAPLGSW